MEYFHLLCSFVKLINLICRICEMYYHHHQNIWLDSELIYKWNTSTFFNNLLIAFSVNRFALNDNNKI